MTPDKGRMVRRVKGSHCPTKTNQAGSSHKHRYLKKYFLVLVSLQPLVGGCLGDQKKKKKIHLSNKVVLFCMDF